MAASDASATFFQRLAGTLLWSLILKVFTFALTTLFTRLVTPDVRGVTFYLDLYVDFIGFLAKEAVRSAVLRSTIRTADLHTQPNRRRCLMDVIFLFNSAIWSVVCAIGMLAINEACAWGVGAERYVLPSLLGVLARLDTPMHKSSVLLSAILFMLGLALQAAAEPKVCLMQALMQYRTKVSAESSALGARLMVLLAAAVATPWLLSTRPLLVTSAAHFAYGAAYFVVFEQSWNRAARKAKVNPTTAPSADTFVAVLAALHTEGELGNNWGGYSFVTLPLMVQQAKRLGGVWWQFFSESTMRVVLTEGEKFALAALGTLSEQGVFDAVTNLGGIVARLVFRLWEESCFARWSSMMGGGGGGDEATKDTTANTRLKRWEACYALLESMLGVAVQTSAAFAVFGPPLSQPLLRILYSDRWGSAESAAVLSRLCVALPLMAVNGLLEAFVRGTSSTAGLRRSKVVMFVTSALYVGSCFALLSSTSRGVVGLMEASIITTFVRMVLSSWLIQHEHKDALRAAGVNSRDAQAFHPLSRSFTWLPPAFWGSVVAVGAVSWRTLEYQLVSIATVPPMLIVKIGGLLFVYAAIAFLCDGPSRVLSNAVGRALRLRK